MPDFSDHPFLFPYLERDSHNLPIYEISFLRREKEYRHGYYSIRKFLSVGFLILSIGKTFIKKTIESAEISTVKESAVVIICTPETPPGENQNVKHNLKVFKKIIPAIARFAAKSVLLIVTRPADVMSYIAWKLSGFPSNRVLGIGTLIDCARLQDFVSRRLNVARSSVSCMTIGSQGDMAGTYYPPSPYFFPLSSPSPSFRSSPLVEHLRGRNEASGHKFEDRGAGRSREVVRNRGEREERVSDRRERGGGRNGRS